MDNLAMSADFWEGRAQHRDDLATCAEADGLPEVAEEHRKIAAGYRRRAKQLRSIEAERE